jgi:Ca2+-transporting ATPase
MNWHILSIHKIYDLLGTRPEGLSANEAEHNLSTFGLNQLAEKGKKPVWKLVLAQFQDIMILILAAAAILSGFLGDLKDTIVILIIVVLNAVVGFVQEFRAEKAVESLKKMTTTSARVRRKAGMLQIPSTELVPGDIVSLETGDMVPADLRLTEVHTLRIEEASLTGESNAVEKTTAVLKEEDTPLGDRTNMAYKSTLVTYGRGTGVVVATGMQTEIGGIAQLLQVPSSMTPLQKRLAQFGKNLSFIALAICALMFLSGWLRGENPMQMLLTALSVAVAAIPEALPAVVTISLALGARKMVRSQALIRKLPAVETLGSVTYICTDKTGTLTQNKMTVRELWTANIQVPELPGMDTEAFLVLCLYANQDTTKDADGLLTGDPTEIALAQFAEQHPSFQAGWKDHFPRIFEAPFDSERKMMTTVHPLGDRFLVITKGALESILENSKHADGTISEYAEGLAEKGMRVLAYAYRLIDQHPEGMSMEELESQLTCCGLAGMIDPPRAEAKQAVAECVAAGIVPVMITGDHPATAQAIAREIGILKTDKDQVITGKALDALSESDFSKRVTHIKVYARVSPEQKLYIVKTLQAQNQYVAMTGDGVNDAPALQRANIGVAMGITGSDVSKEAADMILLDDNFATIVKAVREGRRIYDNIRKFIRYIMTGNSGEIWAIAVAPFLGMPIPLLPIHILWINLVTDGLPSLALANEPEEKDLMLRKPREPNESIFADGMGWQILFGGLLMGAVCLSLQYWCKVNGIQHWQTMVFTVLCMSQMGYALAVRSEREFLFRQGFLSNIALTGAVLLTFVLQLAIIYVPFLQKIFLTYPLTVKELLLCMALSSVVFHAAELEKWVKIIRRKRKATKQTPIKKPKPNPA